MPFSRIWKRSCHMYMCMLSITDFYIIFKFYYTEYLILHMFTYNQDVADRICTQSLRNLSALSESLSLHIYSFQMQIYEKMWLHGNLIWEILGLCVNIHISPSRCYVVSLLRQNCIVTVVSFFSMRSAILSESTQRTERRSSEWLLN